jgi:Subtilase family
MTFSNRSNTGRRHQRGKWLPRRPGWPVRARTAAVAALGLLAAGGITAPQSLASALAPAAPAPAARLAPASTAPASAPAPSQTVLLINGDQVTTTPMPSGLREAVTRAPAGGAAGALVKLAVGGSAYEIPADALPYLNQGLSPALFDLSSLAELESGGRLPVQVSYQGPLHALPGVTITSSGGGTARGYLTAASAREFGAALGRQAAADHATASYGTDGMFAGGVTIGLPGQSAPARVKPDVPMHTLTVKGTDLAGGPDTGDTVQLWSLDSASVNAVTGVFNVFYHGTAKYSVPAGHYLAVAYFTDFSGTTMVGFRAVTLPQFTVAGNTAISLDERTANSQVEFVTPRPAVVQDVTLSVYRVMADGGIIELGLDGLQGLFAGTATGLLPIWTNVTTRPVTIGKLWAAATGYLTSPASAPSPYEYDLAAASPSGVIGPQRHVLTPASLATVHANFYQDHSTTGSWTPVGVFAFQWQDPGTAEALQYIGFLDSFMISLPRAETQYFSAGPALYWENQYAEDWNLGIGIQDDVARTFSPGEVTTENWNAYPLHPTPGVSVLGTGNPYPVQPEGTRAGNQLSLVMTPFGDNTPGHTSWGFGLVGPTDTISGTYALYKNGTLIASGNAVTAPRIGFGSLLVQAGVGSKPASMKFVLTAARTGPDYQLSTASQTTWTWRSVPHSGAKLPKGWTCPTLTTPTQSCSVEPMMTLLYQVGGLAVDGTAPAGPQQIQITAGHLQLSRAAKITGASAQFSVDGGTTWQPASVTPTGGGRFNVTFTAPPGAQVSLQVQASDAAGGQITETITSAYQTAASDPGSSQLPPPAPGDGPMRAACPSAPAGQARCFALFAAQDRVNAAIAAGANGAAAAPAGWGATDIESAYNLPVTRETNQTVAVVDAYSTPALAANLAVYRKQYGLPACTVASGCLRIVNQNGKTAPLPTSGVPYGWDVETMLDVSMVSAACPHCKILVVEGSSATFADLATAENTAARLGAQVISNSYGAQETGFSQSYAASYDHPGHAVVVAVGDYGFGPANFPANLATVTAVGGTQLSRASNARGWAEQVWNTGLGYAGGSGCSAYVAKPSWQHDPHCGMRTVGDVSAVASNIPIYEKIRGGWLTVAGTSVAAPLIAGIYGLAGNAATIKPGYEYSRQGSLFDITRGNNDVTSPGGGAECGFDYLCVAKKGYDAPTGLGTPDGIGAF